MWITKILIYRQNTKNRYLNLPNYISCICCIFFIYHSCMNLFKLKQYRLRKIYSKIFCIIFLATKNIFRLRMHIHSIVAENDEYLYWTKHQYFHQYFLFVYRIVSDIFELQRLEGIFFLPHKIIQRRNIF